MVSNLLSTVLLLSACTVASPTLFYPSPCPAAAISPVPVLQECYTLSRLKKHPSLLTTPSTPPSPPSLSPPPR
eukprot:768661-Hanusia_phi.AAC.5